MPQGLNDKDRVTIEEIEENPDLIVNMREAYIMVRYKEINLHVVDVVV